MKQPEVSISDAGTEHENNDAAIEYENNHT
jgi:hypothetical protein